jgi:transcription antitermination protein NusB
MKPRTRARSIALQALYEIDVSGHLPADVIQDRLSEANLEPTLEEFVRKIVLGVWSIVITLDHFIAENAPEWPLDQVAIIDRNIIRIAFWEFAIDTETPVKVAINEAVELSKVFGSDSTPRFVNGVLGSLAARSSDIENKIKGYSVKK